MNVKNVEKENGSAKVTVEIAKDEFQTALDKAYAKIRKDIMIPGFRKGKAPRKFVERMYGSQVFYEDAVSEIFPDIYEAAIVKQELKAVGQPSVTDMQTPEDGSVVLTVSTELYPEVTLGEYKGIEVPKESVSISKAEVDAELSRMQERNARIETVDREAKTGDTVVLDFEGFVDGKPFDGGKAEGYTLTLGSGAFIPGFEDQLAGMKAGDEKDVVVTFPENYTKELALRSTPRGGPARPRPSSARSTRSRRPSSPNSTTSLPRTSPNTTRWPRSRRASRPTSPQSVRKLLTASLKMKPSSSQART